MRSLTPAELDAYFARVAYTGPREPTLPVLHAITSAHTRSVPFENLDALLGTPIELTVDALVDKIVHRRRGGYCFEQNGLFLEVLTALGFAVTPLSARVRLDRPREVVPPRTHLFLRVDLDGETWLTDVGIGGVSLTCAIGWEPDGADEQRAQQTPHEPRRVVREGGKWFHQVRFGQQWADVYEFTGEEMPLVDREVGNWYTSAHPQSHFRHRLMVARAGDQGRRLTLTDTELKVRDRDGHAESTPIGSPDELLTALDEHFGLRFAPGTRFAPLTAAAT
ncbi:arylamine N-acetyltransferase family protein [Pseudonocardia lacus]|uniref:arylamine N-acetyltransferase family protein n=1 Tax=Pseudonocardia lacus TaxID=2835865 RepID=UPI001BDC2D82|nr:arylamine N-acetyltransferase [Pseudonocardia lacus]